MSNHPFAVSLYPDIQVKNTEDYHTLQSSESDPTVLLTLATTPEIGIALDRLKIGKTPPESLVQTLADLDGHTAGEQFAQMLQQLDERGWLSYIAGTPSPRFRRSLLDEPTIIIYQTCIKKLGVT